MTRAIAQRRARKQRRFAMYLKRGVRSRHAARTAAVGRAAWASVIVMAALTLTLITAAAGAAASYYQSETPLIAGLKQTVASQDSLRIYDSKGTLLYELRDFGAQHSVSLATVPITVVNATVAIEDHDFWNNQGVDFTSIVRALVTNLQQGHITQGGSTITQQLVKQQLLRDSDTDFARKLREAILSIGITTQGVYTKRDILELYLDSIPYSPTAYGIDAAAREYFGYNDDQRTGMTAAQHLDLAQASMLAGIPQNPNLNDPLLHPEHAHQRHRQVLDAMVTYGYITKAQADAAYKEALRPNFFHPVTTEQNLAPHFVNYVRDQLDQMVETGQLRNISRSGLNVYTTLDLDLQNKTQQIMQNHIYGNDATGFTGYTLSSAHVSNSAAVMADQHTGAIKVLLGSVDYYSTQIDGKFDVATQGNRGPGSSFKPLVYATAFEKGWFPAMTVADEPTVFWDEGSNQPYKPLNYNRDHFKGEITQRTALPYSLNIPADTVMQYAGIQDVEQNAQRWGIHSWNGTWGLSSVLGTLEVHPIDMVQVYTVFANYGQYIPLHAIDKIADSTGNVLFQYHVPQPVQVMDPRIAFLITSILSDNPSRAGDFGGCSFLYLDPLNPDPSNPFTQRCAQLATQNWTTPDAYPAAAKTGTGSDFKDDWTMGYTRQLTMGVWVGNNDDTPMVHVDGIHGAAPIWNRAMLYALERANAPKLDFPVPQGVHRATYTSNGVTSTDWFLNGPTPPSNIGLGGDHPCISIDANGDWQYCAAPPPSPNGTNGGGNNGGGGGNGGGNGGGGGRGGG